MANTFICVIMTMLCIYETVLCESCKSLNKTATATVHICTEMAVEGNRVNINVDKDRAIGTNCTCNIHHTEPNLTVTISTYPVNGISGVEFISDDKKLTNRMELSTYNGTPIFLVKETDRPVSFCLVIVVKAFKTSVKLQCHKSAMPQGPISETEGESKDSVDEDEDRNQITTVTSKSATTINTSQKEEDISTTPSVEVSSTSADVQEKEIDGTESGSSEIGLIIGVVFIVLASIVAGGVCVVRKRRSIRHNIISINGKGTSAENEHYYMRENECYVSADLATDTVQFEGPIDAHTDRVIHEDSNVYNEIGDNNSNCLNVPECNSSTPDAQNNIYDSSITGNVSANTGDLNIYSTSCLEGDYNRLDEVIPQRTIEENIYNQAAGSVFNDKDV